MENTKIQTVILAGGRGTRMNSDLPKVLHCLKGKTIIESVIDNVSPLCPKPVMIVGHRGDEVIKAVGDRATFVWQKEQLGTGHAVACAKETLLAQNAQTIVVLPGDHPSIRTSTIKSLIESHERKEAKLTIATILLPDFTDYRESFYNFGRIIRTPEGDISGIVELKDATDGQKAIKEVNAAYYCFDADWLWQNISKLGSDNKAGEFYLTDLIAIAASQSEPINSIAITDPREGLGVNTPAQLQIAEKYLG